MLDTHTHKNSARHTGEGKPKKSSEAWASKSVSTNYGLETHAQVTDKFYLFIYCTKCNF